MLSTFHIALIRGSYVSWRREGASAPRPFWPNFGGKVVLSSDHVLVRIELHEAIVELDPKSKMSQGYWSSEHNVKLFMFMLVHKVSVCARF